MDYIYFMAEAEGLLPTRAGRINAIIQDIKDQPYTRITEAQFREIVERNGIKYSTLTDREIRYIQASI